jgi:hypothetical protein
VTRTWRVYLSVVGIAVIAYFLLSTGAQSLLYDAIALSAAAAMMGGIWLRRPQPISAWILLAMGVLLLAIGDVAYGTSQPVPSIADMFYISGHALLMLGVFGLAAERTHRRPLSMIVISTCVAGGIGALSWLFLIAPSKNGGGIHMATQAVAMGYPLLDLLLLGLLLWAVGSDRLKTAPLGFMALAFALMLAADIGYAMQNFGTQYVLGGMLDAAWLVSYGLLGATLLHPAVLGERVVLLKATTPAATSRGPAVSTGPSVLRFGIILKWAGAMLLVLAATALLLGGIWGLANIVLLSGAYGITGSLLLITGVIGS